MAARRYFNPFYQLNFIWQLTKYPAMAQKVKKYRENLFEQVNRCYSRYQVANSLFSKK